MKKRSGGGTAAKSLATAAATRASNPSSYKAKPLGFDLSIAGGAATSRKILSSPASPVPRGSAAVATPSSAKPLATVADLKDMVSARSESLKRNFELCHAEVLKDFDASHTRIAKRFKLQTQACMQLAEEAEKEYKKMADRITENTELMKAEYAKLIKEAQATASRVCKVSIPEVAQSLEKAIDDLRSRYGIPTTQV